MKRAYLPFLGLAQRTIGAPVPQRFPDVPHMGRAWRAVIMAGVPLFTAIFFSISLQEGAHSAHSVTSLQDHKEALAGRRAPGYEHHGKPTMTAIVIRDGHACRAPADSVVSRPIAPPQTRVDAGGLITSVPGCSESALHTAG